MFTKEENWEFKINKFIVIEVGLTVLDRKAEDRAKIALASAHQGEEYATLSYSQSFTKKPHTIEYIKYTLLFRKIGAWALYPTYQM